MDYNPLKSNIFNINIFKKRLNRLLGWFAVQVHNLFHPGVFVGVNQLCIVLSVEQKEVRADMGEIFPRLCAHYQTKL